MNIIARSFFVRPTLPVAQELLGKVINVRGTKGIITETEAYLPHDEASHSFCGKTARNAAMFETGGTVYVYRSYGIHFCVNIVTEETGIGSAVLLRSVLPVPESVSVFQKRRGDRVLPKNLSNGPGKLCQAMGISLVDNMSDCCGLNSDIVLEDIGFFPQKISASKRIGISKNTEKEWRFFFSPDEIGSFL
jgi:DNA-3-methyladenine glycosylase